MNYGDAQLVSTDSTSDYFAQARIDRMNSKEKGNTTEKTQVVDSKNDNTEAKDESKNNDKKEETSSLEKNAYPEVNSLINSFYEAWGRKDIEQMKQLTDNLDAADEAKVTNSTYIESYNDITVYTKPGLTDDSYVVYASYKLKFTDTSSHRRAGGLHR